MESCLEMHLKISKKARSNPGTREHPMEWPGSQATPGGGPPDVSILASAQFQHRWLPRPSTIRLPPASCIRRATLRWGQALIRSGGMQPSPNNSTIAPITRFSLPSSTICRVEARATQLRRNAQAMLVELGNLRPMSHAGDAGITDKVRSLVRVYAYTYWKIQGRVRETGVISRLTVELPPD